MRRRRRAGNLPSGAKPYQFLSLTFCLTIVFLCFFPQVEECFLPAKIVAQLCFFFHFVGVGEHIRTQCRFQHRCQRRRLLGGAGREEEDGAGTPFFMLVVYSSPSSRGREGEVARQ